MVAYMVYFCDTIHDRKELEVYWSKINPTIGRFQPKLLSLYAPMEQLEGERPVLGMTLIEFPTMDLARGWYESPEYQAIKHHRQNNTEFTGLIAEGGSLPVAERMLGTDYVPLKKPVPVVGT